jgi:membrane protein insertase Oxa1/YidC/SpoIIIJ
MPWMVQLSHNIHLFDATLFGVVNLTRAALGPKGIYWPAMVIVVASAIMQYYQSKQLLPDEKDQRGLRSILKDAGSGKPADQAEVNAAVGRSTRYFLPIMIFLFTVNIASALSLYWLVGGIVAFIQQAIVLREDTDEMEAEVKTTTKQKDTAALAEAEVVSEPKAAEPVAKAAKPKGSKSKKRRKK